MKIISIPLLFLAINVFAQNQLAIIVHPSSTIQNINERELEQIFLSKTKYLPDGQKAKPAETVSLPLKSMFYERVSGKNEMELRKYWATMVFTGNGQQPKQLRTSSELLEYVKEHRGAIAYIQKDAVDSSVKILTVIE